MKKALVLLADGFEEVEALTPVDYLRRAGIEVKTVGVSGAIVEGGHGILVRADMELSELSTPVDCLVVPGGGKGADNLAANAAVVDLIRRHFFSGGLVAAICAAPAVVLHEACGILSGRSFTGFPGTETRVTGAEFWKDRVVVDGNLITSRAAGCSGEFAYAIVEALVGKAAADELADRVLLADR
ncbi:MAG TPA: DJ-1 family glyoxalase III [Rectinemataceae bacterium]|nr:DJ-1 family glyoxalase III [Rectinemataceae bacterium]